MIPQWLSGEKDTSALGSDIQECLNTLNLRFSVNGLKLNKKKTQIMYLNKLNQICPI